MIWAGFTHAIVRALVSTPVATLINLSILAAMAPAYCFDVQFCHVFQGVAVMRALKSVLLLAGMLTVPAAANAAPPRPTADAAPGYSLIQAPGKTCRREPIWGFRMSPFCKPTGICSDRVIKGYRTVCS